eukprot:COSAG01_NODE_50_length_31487_cov_90.470243_30_plen_114_part_00
MDMREYHAGIAPPITQGVASTYHGLIHHVFNAPWGGICLSAWVAFACGAAGVEAWNPLRGADPLHHSCLFLVLRKQVDLVHVCDAFKSKHYCWSSVLLLAQCHHMPLTVNVRG